MRRRRWGALALVTVLVLVLGACEVEEPEETVQASGDVAVAPETTTTTAVPRTTTTTEPPTTTTAAARGDSTTVGSITDGDTFRTSSGERVRIIGVDTPERGDCYYREATAHLATLIPPGTKIRLEYDVERRDRYGRTLAYVYRAGDGLFVNLAMAEDGYALQLTIPPNVAHADEFGAAVARARGANRGLWGGCRTAAAPAPSSAPSTTVTPHPPPPLQPAGGACHSSYEGTCIPPDVSDADCAGGSGDGPWYVRERDVRVVGPDVFRLDHDGNGLGCES